MPWKICIYGLYSSLISAPVLMYDFQIKDKCYTIKQVAKCFGHIPDDGAYYFEEKLLDASGQHGPLSASSSVVRGLTAFATATSTSLNVCTMTDHVHRCTKSLLTSLWFRSRLICAFITNLQLPGDKISGLAKFFLGIGVPGNAKDFYYQIDALACLESNRQVIKKYLSKLCCWCVSLGLVKICSYDTTFCFVYLLY